MLEYSKYEVFNKVGYISEITGLYDSNFLILYPHVNPSINVNLQLVGNCECQVIILG